MICGVVAAPQLVMVQGCSCQLVHEGTFRHNQHNNDRNALELLLSKVRLVATDQMRTAGHVPMPAINLLSCHWG